MKGLLDRIRPDFYYSLHNAWAGGAFYFLSHPIAQRYHEDLYQLLEQHRIRLQTSAPHRIWCREFGAGIYEMFTMKKYYDALEGTTPASETVLDSGGSSWEYLAELNDRALCFVAETAVCEASQRWIEDAHRGASAPFEAQGGCGE